MPRESGASSTPWSFSSMNQHLVTLDRPLSRAMTDTMDYGNVLYSLIP